MCGAPKLPPNTTKNKKMEPYSNVLPYNGWSHEDIRYNFGFNSCVKISNGFVIGKMITINYVDTYTQTNHVYISGLN